jgi:hypothetical protein
MEVDLSCPRCGEPVLDPGEYTVGKRDACQQRANCPQCHTELVRDPDLADNGWKVEKPTPPSDEELGVGD